MQGISVRCVINEVDFVDLVWMVVSYQIFVLEGMYDWSLQFVGQGQYLVDGIVVVIVGEDGY